MYTNKLTIINDQYPDAWNNAKLFKALLMDYYPEDKLLRNLIFTCVEERIPQKMVKLNSCNNMELYKYANLVVSAHGCSIEKAKEVVLLWAEALNIQCIQTPPIYNKERMSFDIEVLESKVVYPMYAICKNRSAVVELNNIKVTVEGKLLKILLSVKRLTNLEQLTDNIVVGFCWKLCLDWKPYATNDLYDINDLDVYDAVEWVDDRLQIGETKEVCIEYIMPEEFPKNWKDQGARLVIGFDDLDWQRMIVYPTHAVCTNKKTVLELNDIYVNLDDNRLNIFLTMKLLSDSRISIDKGSIGFEWVLFDSKCGDIYYEQEWRTSNLQIEESTDVNIVYEIPKELLDPIVQYEIAFRDI